MLLLSAQIPVVTLDHYWKNVLGSKQVAFVKIDVEGHEYQVCGWGHKEGGGGAGGARVPDRWEGTAGIQGHGEEMGDAMIRVEMAVMLLSHTLPPSPLPPPGAGGGQGDDEVRPPRLRAHRVLPLHAQHQEGHHRLLPQAHRLLRLPHLRLPAEGEGREGREGREDSLLKGGTPNCMASSPPCVSLRKICVERSEPHHLCTQLTAPEPPPPTHTGGGAARQGGREPAGHPLPVTEQPDGPAAGAEEAVPGRDDAAALWVWILESVDTMDVGA